ncbi:Rv1733c family protein [Streptomyces naganishii]|uniref:Integral membrane protein n=1 Tax=Streptomyces naganishii JCM 4654 TaxID=1306179 RepID=A0A918Y070_9ACTN|nr:hypothetical protein [Streptomyces naganishii]GHD86280.1 hypothetical protein GCM10010508_13740 [Streptomyces naganishii JCM 4654]
MAFRGPKVWLWRWRRNPLKRRADTVEAWALLGAWVVTVLAGVLAGWTASRGVEHGLARERLDWRPAVALVIRQAPGSSGSAAAGTANGGGRPVGDGSGVGTGGEVDDPNAVDAMNTASDGGGPRVWTEVRWTGQDGTPHTGQARVRPGSAVGTPVTVWTDSGGRLVTRPATAAQAHTRAVMIGALVGVSAAAVPFVAGRVVRGRLERRRLDQWDTEWTDFGPTWSRKTW